MHALETDDVLALARRVAALAPDVPIVVGGHTAAAYPEPFLTADVDAVVLDDGERVLPRVVDALERGGRSRDVPGLVARERARASRRRPPARPGTLRARRRAAAGAASRGDRWRRQYACLAHRPTWLVETARGCPFRCSFCSIWQLHARSVRERSIDSVCQDFAASAITCSSPTICSGITRRAAWRWRRSCGAAASASSGCWCRAASISWRGTRSCSRRGGRSRSDFDIFFGLEAATNEGLNGLVKDATVDHTAPGHRRRARARLRRHRQLRHRSGLGARPTSSGCGRSSSSISCSRPASRF